MDKPEESRHQRLTRNFAELLQELRVAQAGVQILFGFLLTVSFTDLYRRGTAFQHVVHLTTVLCAVAAAALLTAPAAWHRVLFREGQREEIVRAANRFALSGLAFLAAAMTGTVLLIFGAVVSTPFAVVIAVGVGFGFVMLWFVQPRLSRRRRGTSD